MKSWIERICKYFECRHDQIDDCHYFRLHDTFDNTIILVESDCSVMQVKYMDSEVLKADFDFKSENYVVGQEYQAFEKMFWKVKEKDNDFIDECSMLSASVGLKEDPIFGKECF